MSLEQQVTALVASANALTGAVNAKIGQIDQKVDQSISDLNNAFPAKYQEFSDRTHYVSLTNGNDANDGKSWAKSFRTLKKALEAGTGALSQTIYLSEGVHVINDRFYPKADTVTIVGNNQSHYPAGNYSDATSTVIHIDKTLDVRSGIVSKLFGKIFINMCVFRFEGKPEDTSIENTAIYGLGHIGLRIPLFDFDSANRGVMCAASYFNPFSSLGCEQPMFKGVAASYVKGQGSTCILNLDRVIDKTTGMQQKSGAVVILS